MMNIFLKQISIGPMMNYAYLVGALDTNLVIAIDAAWDAKKIISEAEKNGKKITAVLLTHTHFDHCNAVDELSKAMKVPVYVHEKEVKNVSNTLNIKTTKDGMTIAEAGLKVLCIHTPGHTPGSQCFLINDAIFTGDTLFVDSCGRVDLPGSNPQDMKSSLLKIASLPENIIVFPGHNYGLVPYSTIGQQKKSNPYLSGDLY